MIVEHGLVVTLDFELRDAQGLIIQEHGGEPIVYLHGSQDEIFPKLQESVNGKAVGDEVFVQLEPEDAFGYFDPELIRIEPLETFDEEIEIGMRIQELPVHAESQSDELANQEDTEREQMWTVTDIEQGQVVLDGNHPFAGLSLRYHLRILDIRVANEEETALGAATQSLLSIVSEKN